MARSGAFSRLLRCARIADYCGRFRLPTKEGCAPVALPERRAGRREFLKTAGLAAIGLGANVTGPLGKVLAAKAPGSDVKIGIVGAGMAGLVCGDELRKNGIVATIFDANTRTGGRCWSLRNFFPGQVAERGGEFIDTLHKTRSVWRNI